MPSARKAVLGLLAGGVAGCAGDRSAPGTDASPS